MTTDDAVKTVFGSVISLMAIAVGWLLRTVLGNDKALTLQEAKVKELETKLTDLKTSIAEVKKDQITKDAVREVIETALDRRDKIAETRKVEWDKFNSREIREIVSQELDKRLNRKNVGD